jgi:hypothetical protein
MCIIVLELVKGGVACLACIKNYKVPNFVIGVVVQLAGWGRKKIIIAIAIKR